MTGPGFSLDQLMELAGLVQITMYPSHLILIYLISCFAIKAVANAAMELIDWETSTIEKNVLIACGPGNNGGDGLVAARHLKHFGLSPKVLYPKPNSSPLFLNLVQQCDDLDIPILASVPSNDERNFSANSLIIDALFGFSFHGPPRPPFEDIIRQIAQTKSSVLSVDIPSGWNVDEGDIHGLAFNPGAVISLTLPKPCMKSYEGIHFLGGR